MTTSARNIPAADLRAGDRLVVSGEIVDVEHVARTDAGRVDVITSRGRLVFEPGWPVHAITLNAATVPAGDLRYGDLIVDPTDPDTVVAVAGIEHGGEPAGITIWLQNGKGRRHVIETTTDRKFDRITTGGNR
jgi:hypothetical protein